MPYWERGIIDGEKIEWIGGRTERTGDGSSQE